MARNKINTEEQNTVLKRNPLKNNSQDGDKLRVKLYTVLKYFSSRCINKNKLHRNAHSYVFKHLQERLYDNYNDTFQLYNRGDVRGASQFRRKNRHVFDRRINVHVCPRTFSTASSSTVNSTDQQRANVERAIGYRVLSRSISDRTARSLNRRSRRSANQAKCIDRGIARWERLEGWWFTESAGRTAGVEVTGRRKG